MNADSISADQFRQIIRVCERIMIDTSTSAEELRSYLVLRLRYDHPVIARALAALDDDQSDLLCQDIRQALCINPNRFGAIHQEAW
jgi:hypothetical protein